MQTWNTFLSGLAEFWRCICEWCLARKHDIDAIIANLHEDTQNFNLNNTDEVKVLRSHYFSGYRGHLVLRFAGVGNRSFSVGILCIGKGRNVDADTVRHEYGHTLQLKQVGLCAYLAHYALPSLRSGKLPSHEYYRKPWEASADYYGGVQSRTHSDETLHASFSYAQSVLGKKRT
jgi:hypothetical protein